MMEKEKNISSETSSEVKGYIAVVGRTGVGKSSFINTFRGVKKNSKNFARVGYSVKECTIELTYYPFKGNKNLKMWDLPGANTTNFPLATYSTDVKMHLYDAFIMMTSNIFEETDREVLKQILKTKRPFYLARTQTDIILSNKIDDLYDDYDDNDNVPEAEIWQRLDSFLAEERKNCCELFSTIEGLQMPVDVYFLRVKTKKDFLKKGLWTPDNDKLRERILKDLPDIQGAALGSKKGRIKKKKICFAYF